MNHKPKKQPGQKRQKPMSTPVRQALKPKSALQQFVKDGLEALAKEHRHYIETALRAEFGDSLDIDKAFLSGHEEENRWDYLLGYMPSGKVIALEPHSAKQSEISAIIAKRKAAREQLQIHLQSHARIAAWLWVASGNVHFADTEKVRRQLDQNGIRFVGKRVLRKHLSNGT